MGFGKHTYQHLDPSNTNTEEWAKDLRGEQQHHGDVREYNTAGNEKHPENNVTLDDLSRPGTVFATLAEGLQDHGWLVTNFPIVRSPATYCRAKPVDFQEESHEQLKVIGPEREIALTDLGCAVGADNLFKQVKTTIVVKARVGKTQRKARLGVE